MAKPSLISGRRPERPIGTSNWCFGLEVQCADSFHELTRTARPGTGNGEHNASPQCVTHSSQTRPRHLLRGGFSNAALQGKPIAMRKILRHHAREHVDQLRSRAAVGTRQEVLGKVRFGLPNWGAPKVPCGGCPRIPF